MCKGIFSLISLLSQQHEAGWRERRKNCRKGNSQRVPSLPGIWHARTKKYLQEFANKTAHVLCIDPHKQTEKASNDTLSCSFLSMHFTLSFKFHQNPKLCIKKSSLTWWEWVQRGTRLLRGSGWWSWVCWRTHMANLSVLALSPHLSPAASSLAKRDRSLPSKR